MPVLRESLLPKNAAAAGFARHPFALISVSVAIGLTLKLYLALSTFGTNDVTYWQEFMRWIVDHDSVSIYRDYKWNNLRIYNHPPLMSGYLWLIHYLVDWAPNGFSFLMRMPAILADCLTPFIVYRLLRSTGAANQALQSALLLGVSPILIQISGFHGNTDPVFLLFICLSLFFLAEKRAVKTSALFYGLAMNIKIVPVIFLPVIFFSIISKKDRVHWTLVFVLVCLAGFGYHLFKDFDAVAHNIFGYAGTAGNWGITKFIRGTPGMLLLPTLKVFILSGITFTSWQVFSDLKQYTVEWQRALLESFGMATLFFFVFTPGFAVQYLAWIGILGIFLGFKKSVILHLSGGLFLFLVYTFWCKGLPWNFANSDEMKQWRGAASVLDTAIWIFLSHWLLYKWAEYKVKYIKHAARI